MSKHPGPWFLNQYGQLLDGTGVVICKVETADPETRIVLLHAGEMFAAIMRVIEARQDSRDEREAEAALWDLGIKIESEIAAGRKL